jgi:PPK2 family polyphosphate:nucleotide phosphotransferase
VKEIKRYRVKPGDKFDWKDFKPGSHGSYKTEQEVVDDTEQSIARLIKLQERLYAEHKRSLLIVLQAMDTGGKDGTIRHVMKGVNPQGCQVSSFKAPTPEERDHDFLWRIHRSVPGRGMIGIFNRSQYEDVLVTRVHKLIDDDEAERRFDQINEFEKSLCKNGVTILKFYLAISKDEQKRRLQARLDDPHKNWKFSTNDLAERANWEEYQKVYGEAVSATSTKFAPWFVVPANHKWYRNHIVAKIIADTLEEMDPQFPEPEQGVDFKTVKIPD